jgi:hypothetical protein
MHCGHTVRKIVQSRYTCLLIGFVCNMPFVLNKLCGAAEGMERLLPTGCGCDVLLT